VSALGPELAELAASAGIQVSYVTFQGKKRRIDTEVIVAVLQALGVPIEGPGDAPALLAARRAERRARLEPVIVHRTDTGVDTPVAIGDLPDPKRAWVTLRHEQGWTVHARVSEVTRGPGGSISLEALAGGAVLPGYHELALEADGREEAALLIAAPRCPAARRGWGVFLPLYAVRTEADWGAGSYPDLAELGRFAGAAGASFVGTLPLYPGFLGEPADPSPYRPVTRLGYNELYVDVAAVAELADAPGARRVLQSERFVERVRAAHDAELVPYEELAVLRREVLQPLADALVGDVGLRSFAADHPELVAYAGFRSAGERHGRDWRRWPSAAAETGTDAVLADAAARYHLCAQWLAHTQLAKAAALAHLYGDFPVGVHPDGFDPFFAPESFASGATGGAPPDPFFARGQDWAIPPLHPVGLRDQRYRHLIDVLRVALAHVTVLRVDHVMGLHRLWWVPQGFDAAHGAYVTYRADELHALVALEAHRAGAVVVGEDLGTVEPEVRRAMAEDRMLGTFVLEFRARPEDPLPAPPRQCIASLENHDMPRFAAFYRGAAPGRTNDVAELARGPDPANADRARWRTALARQLDATGFMAPPGPADGGGQPAEERRALAACLAHLAASEAALVLVDLADLWGELEQENRPGTGPEALNWRRRASRTLEEAVADPRVGDLLALVDASRSLEEAYP
jgi:4-alpha-glucanotransferase